MNAIEMQSVLEEIKESFNVLNDEVQMYQAECERDDIRECNGDVFMAMKKTSLYTQYFKSIFNLLECAEIMMNAQLEVVNKQVEREEEEQRELEEAEARFQAGYPHGVLDDVRLWKVI